MFKRIKNKEKVIKGGRMSLMKSLKTAAEDPWTQLFCEGGGK